MAKGDRKDRTTTDASAPKGDAGVRRFDVYRTGTDLIINLLETNLDRLRHDAGWDITGVNLLPTMLREKVLETVKEHGSTVAFLETGMKVAVLGLFPKLGASAKDSIGAIIDFYVDELRAAANEVNDRKAEARVSQAAGGVKSRIDKIIEDAKADKVKKSTFDAIFFKLPPYKRMVLTDLTAWMAENSPPEAPNTHPHFDNWLSFKDKISSVEALEDLVLVIEGESGDEEAQAKACIRYLRAHYGEKAKEPGLKEVVIAVLRGDKDNPHAKRVQKGIDTFTEHANTYARETRKDTEKRRKSAPHGMSFGWYAGLCLLLFAGILGFFLSRSLIVLIVGAFIALVFIAVWELAGLSDRLTKKDEPVDEPPTPAAAPDEGAAP
ncbi:MAG: hypothetical protein ABIO72_03260 [Patescibacteria group bacterium]